MYAPLDQILPGRAIPDATWDTYALCVILYMAITGARPAYQSDPRSLLTAQGRDLWALAQEAIHADGGQAQRLRLRFAQGRVGTIAADLLDPTGKSALNTHDRELLSERLAALTEQADAPEGNRRRVQQGIWQILTRGLSPVSHPSPPNRFREAEVLAEQLEDLRDLLHPAPVAAAPEPLPRVLDPDLHAPPRRRGGTLWLLGMMLVASFFLLLITAIAVLIRFPPDTWNADEKTASISPGQVVLTFEGTPEDVQVLNGTRALVHMDELASPGQVDRVGVSLESPVRSAALLALGPDGTPLARVDLGPRPVGEHLATWTPPQGAVRLRVEADPPPSASRPLAEGVLSVSNEDQITLGESATSTDRILAWTGSTDVAAFEMDRTEVTEARWAACVQAGACESVDGERPSAPVVGVTFEEARAFCQHVGGDLPTEAQWLRAHGPARYPWGDERPTCQHAHGAGCGESVQAAGLLPMGATRDGVMDLAGNAWEWVRGETGQGAPLLMGGSVETRGGTLGASARQRARGRSALAGLRCAYETVPDTP